MKSKDIKRICEDFASWRRKDSFPTYRWQRICGEGLGLHFGEKLGKDAGPTERFLKWGRRSTSKEKLERSEQSERSVNRRGVQGSAVGPLLGSRGGAPGSSEVLYICIHQMGLFWDPFVTLSGHIGLPKIDGSHSQTQVEVIPNIQILQIEYIVELKRKYWGTYFVLFFSPTMYQIIVI